MPLKAIIGKNQITEEHLLPHLRNRIGGSNNVLVQYNSTKAETTVQLGEAVTKGTALAIGTNGKAYKASNITSANKPAICIAGEDGNTNSKIKIILSDIVEVIGASLTSGNPVWLTSDTPNISTTIPANEQGKRIQRLGHALSSTTFIVDIENSYCIL